MNELNKIAHLIKYKWLKKKETINMYQFFQSTKSENLTKLLTT